MSPENHAIRDLEKRMLDATLDELAAMERVIAALNTCILNTKNSAASEYAKRGLLTEIEALEKVMRR